MARVVIPITEVTRQGVNITPGTGETTPDAVDGAMFTNDGRVVLSARNTGAGAHVVTIQTPAKVAGLDVADLQVTVPAGATILIGPFPTSVFNQTAGPDVGMVYVNADGTQTEMRYRALRW